MIADPKMKLTVVYSPHYDGDVYLGDAPNSMGTIYVGNMGLMSFLEQRAGIHYNIKADVAVDTENVRIRRRLMLKEKLIILMPRISIWQTRKEPKMCSLKKQQTLIRLE